MTPTPKPNLLETLSALQLDTCTNPIKIKSSMQGGEV